MTAKSKIIKCDRCKKTSPRGGVHIANKWFTVRVADGSAHANDLYARTKPRVVPRIYCRKCWARAEKALKMDDKK